MASCPHKATGPASIHADVEAVSALSGTPGGLTDAIRYDPAISRLQIEGGV
jgi:hypothetical protein